MITLVIQPSVGPWTRQEATEQTAKEFPGDVALFSSDPSEGIRLKLDQDRLTDEQRDWLHLSMFAREHVESYHVEGAAKPTKREYELAERIMELSHENEHMRAQLQITPELLYAAHHIVSPGEWAKGQSPMSETERVKFTIMADWLNEQIAQRQETKC